MSFLKSGTFWFAAVAIALLITGIVATVCFWEWLRPKEPTTVSNSETLSNVGLLIGGALALVFALWRGWVAERQTSTAQRQADTAHQGLLDERHRRGVEMLGNDDGFIRLAGVHHLELLAREYPEQYHVQIMQLFSDFARNPAWSHGQVEEAEEPYSGPMRRQDVQAAMTAIGARSEQGRDLEKATENFRLALHDVRLSRVNLQGANLAGANLGNAIMRGTFLMDSNLSGVHLPHGDLSDAFLRSADITGALIYNTDMSNANLQGANLSGAFLFNVDLQHANLKAAKLSHADLRGTTLSAADLSGAILQGTNLSGAVFGEGTRPTLSDPTISEAVFARLTQSQLNDACADAANPPKIADGTVDIETGKPLVWCGKPCQGSDD